MLEIECVVVGAGVIGLAVARALAMAGREVIVLERESAIGTHTSSRNSEVIHAGIYYPAGSLKAQHCVRGRDLLYRYCEKNSVPYQRCGKLIVANGSEQESRLDAIRAKASANGVDDIRRLAGDELIALEPSLRATAALLSPSTGVIDSHAYMLQLHADIERHGGMVLLQHGVRGGQAHSASGYSDLRVDTPTGNEVLRARTVINSGGLFATSWLKRVDGFPVSSIPAMYYAKGHYFSLVGRSPFSHLIYPLPSDAGLGVHLTLDLAGKAKFGPDVEWLETTVAADSGIEASSLEPQFDYRVDESRLDTFHAAIHDYYPQLQREALVPDYTGIRPKLVGPGSEAADFVVQSPAQHGVRGWYNLLGMESPGLTSSLSIAQQISDEISAKLDSA